MIALVVSLITYYCRNKTLIRPEGEASQTKLTMWQGLAFFALVFSIFLGLTLSIKGLDFKQTGKSTVRFIPSYMTFLHFPFDEFFMNKKSIFADQLMTASFFTALLQAILTFKIIKFRDPEIINEYNSAAKITQFIKKNCALILILMLIRMFMLYFYFLPTPHDQKSILIIFFPFFYITTTSILVILIFSNIKLYFALRAFKKSLSL